MYVAGAILTEYNAVTSGLVDIIVSYNDII